MHSNNLIIEVDSKAVEHAFQALLGENRLLFVAGALQPDDQTISSQRVIPDARKMRDVFDARACGSGPDKADQRENNDKCGTVHHGIRTEECI